MTLKRHGHMALVTVLAVFVTVALPGAAVAAPGDLDPTFGTGGKVTSDFAGGSDEAFGVALQADGKIVAAGNTDIDFALARYSPDGGLDPSFGSGGKVTTDFAGGFDEATDLVLQADGRIVAAGEAVVAGSEDFALARYSPDGGLDPSFGSGGKVTTDFAGGPDVAFGIALQADGKIVAAGAAGVAGSFDFALARYNPDGSLDGSFGSGGKVTTDFAGGSSVARGVALQADGKIVAAGDTDIDFALARYSPDGSLDPGFGSGGKVTTDFAGGSDHVANVVLQADGKIVAAGTAAVAGSEDFALARYSPDGSLDPSFGGGGTVTTDFSSGFVGGADEASGAAIQADGKIVAAGRADLLGGSAGFALARYSPDGSLDPVFGSGGKVTTDFGGGIAAAFAGPVLQADGKIVAAGTAVVGGSFDFALARYQAIAPTADLSITKSGAPNPVVSGDRLTYTLTVANNGPQDATGVTATDPLAKSVHFNSVSSTQGSCSRSTTTNPLPKDGTVTCSLGNLAKGASASITIVVTTTTPGTLTNTAHVSESETDPNPGNNHVTATTTVNGT